MIDSFSWTSGRPVVAPVEVRVVHDGPGHVRGAVVVVARVLVAEVVREARPVPPDLALDGLGVRVEQQLGRVAPLPRAPAPTGRAPGSRTAGRAPPRAGSRASRRRRSRRAATRRSAVVVEQAQLDLLGHLGEQREVRAAAVVGGAERVGTARPDLDGFRHMGQVLSSSGPNGSARTRPAPPDTCVGHALATWVTKATASGGSTTPCRDRLTAGSDAASSAATGLAGKVQVPVPRLTATATGPRRRSATRLVDRMRS